MSGHTRLLPLAVVVVIGAALIYASLDMPAVRARPITPFISNVAPRYIQDSLEEIDIPNMVTSVLASYRGYDTLGRDGGGVYRRRRRAVAARSRRRP